jgi:hypothetical protein
MTNKARHIRINHSDDKVICFRIDYEQGPHSDREFWRRQRRHLCAYQR